MTIRPDNFVLFPGHIFHDILDTAGIAPGPDVVGRVRCLAADNANLHLGIEAHERERAGLLAIRDMDQKCHEMLGEAGFVFGDVPARLAKLIAEHNARRDTVQACHVALYSAGVQHNGVLTDRLNAFIADNADLSRRLDASERDRVGLLATVEALRGERDSARRHHTNGLETIRKSDEKCAALRAERDALRAELKNSLASESRWEATIRQLRDERDGARQDLHKEGGAAMSTLAEMVREVCEDLAHVKAEALRAPKVAAVEWDGFSLIINGKTAASVGESLARPGIWLVARPGLPLTEAASQDSARRLAELLADHDPGGVWRINGDVVCAATVQLVCPSVAVTWGES